MNSSTKLVVINVTTTCIRPCTKVCAFSWFTALTTYRKSVLTWLPLVLWVFVLSPLTVSWPSRWRLRHLKLTKVVMIARDVRLDIRFWSKYCKHQFHTIIPYFRHGAM